MGNHHTLWTMKLLALLMLAGLSMAQWGMDMEFDLDLKKRQIAMREIELVHKNGQEWELELVDDVEDANSDSEFEKQFDEIHEEDDEHELFRRRHHQGPVEQHHVPRRRVASHDSRHPAGDHADLGYPVDHPAGAGHDAKPFLYKVDDRMYAFERPGHAEVHANGHHDHSREFLGYRFSGRYSPIAADHYVGYGNKYDFRKNYPYGYGEMLDYTPEVGYKLSSGYEKLHTKQPYKYSYDHGYIPLTPVTYAKHAGVKKH